MSLMWIVLTVLLSPTLAIILKHLLQSNGRQGKRLPPGPMGWPLLGSTISFFKPHPPNTLGDFMETQISKYGKVFTMGFAGERTVVSTDPELSRFILHNEMKVVENNTPSHLRSLLGETALGFLRGDAYRFKKSIIISFINHSCGPQSSFVDSVVQTAVRHMSAWRGKDVVRMAEETSRYAFQLVVQLVSGVSSDHPEIEGLRKDVIAFHFGTSVVPINLPGTRYYEALKAKARISKFFQQLVKERKFEKKKCTENTDLIDRFLTNSSFTPAEISDSAILFIFAGLYTTANTLAMAIYFLHRCPKAIEQLREEIQQSMKSKETGKLTWDNYKNMHFTQSIINESLRIGNAAPCLFKRALQDIKFKGYVIPKGTAIMTHMASAHLNPSIYENPTKFDPWRWLGEDGMKKFDSWMPFGGGLRYCAGRDIARLEISVFLHHLVLNYDWEPAELDGPISSPMVRFPKGLPMRIRTRNHSP